MPGGWQHKAISALGQGERLLSSCLWEQEHEDSWMGDFGRSMRYLSSLEL